MTVFRKKTTPRKLMGLVCVGTVLAPAGWTAAQTPIDFNIDSGRVVPGEDFAVKVTVLGSAITSGGVDIPVTVQIQINGQFFEPFGPHNMPLDGDVNDGMNPRHFIIQEVFNPSNRITVTGSGWLMKETPTAQRTTATGSI